MEPLTIGITARLADVGVETIQMVNRAACASCVVSVLDINDAAVAKRAEDMAIRSVPARVIDGKLADCCAGRGPDEATLRSAGLGRPLGQPM